jgi:hypothetical protein
VQEQGGNALQPGGDRFGVGEVGGHRLHTLGQAGGPGAADDGTDLGALVDQDVDQGTSDGTGRSGYQDHAKTSYLHGCLNKIQYWGKYLRWRRSTRKKTGRRPEFTLLVSAGREVSAFALTRPDAEFGVFTQLLLSRASRHSALPGQHSGCGRFGVDRFIVWLPARPWLELKRSLVVCIGGRAAVRLGCGVFGLDQVRPVPLGSGLSRADGPNWFSSRRRTRRAGSAGSEHQQGADADHSRTSPYRRALFQCSSRPRRRGSAFRAVGHRRPDCRETAGGPSCPKSSTPGQA